MRYIGNKTKLLEEIKTLLHEKNILSDEIIFCDAFSGTASVSAFLQPDVRKIIANDYLYMSYVMTQARLNPFPRFRKLAFDPLEYFNNIQFRKSDGGFIYKNYAPTRGKRTFFSDENAIRIDIIRRTIDDWFAKGKINERERYYLIAVLIEAVSKVANIAGVYGAALSHWDPRALKKLTLKELPIISAPKELPEIHNSDIIDLIDKVSGDVLYLDPPYTSNVYTTQYHLLETIAKYDSPKITGKGGLRNMENYSTAFSKPHEAPQLFEKILAKANFKHIILSYSPDGIIPFEYIESSLKRYAVKDTYSITKIDYRRYNNSKSATEKNHCEFLFYIEKKQKDKVVYQSPLNYIGGKSELIPFIKENTPKNIETFFDLFGGGMNISINAEAKHIVYNDTNFKVKELLETISNTPTNVFLSEVERITKKYKLSKGNKEAYLLLRKDYNKLPIAERNPLMLFLLVMYGFQQQIRFNSKYECNNPVGQAGFNNLVKEKLVSFSQVYNDKNISTFSEDYAYFENYIREDDFVYLDPPYLITLGSYNDGKRGFHGWNEEEEYRLLAFLDRLHSKKVRFMLSNVLEHRDRRNNILDEWINRRQDAIRVIEFEGKIRSRRKEIIVVNY